MALLQFFPHFLENANTMALRFRNEMERTSHKSQTYKYLHGMKLGDSKRLSDLFYTVSYEVKEIN